MVPNSVEYSGKVLMNLRESFQKKVMDAAGTDANGKPKDPYYFTFFKEKLEGGDEPANR